MSHSELTAEQRWQRIANGRTDLVFAHVGSGLPATAADAHGTTLLAWCAYYGDVSAIRWLQTQGATLSALGDNLGLNGAAFHGHWQLVQFLLEQGADPNAAQVETGETPLHAALCTSERLTHDHVVEVLLTAGADPNAATLAHRESDGFMRDVRTRGETALHRAAAFGGERTIQMLIDAGAKIDARDAHGDSPLSWASWYRRPVQVLRLLCFGPHRIHPAYRPMRENLQGRPQP